MAAYDRTLSIFHYLRLTASANSPDENYATFPILMKYESKKDCRPLDRRTRAERSNSPLSVIEKPLK